MCTEALSSGIPVVSTICGGPEEYINNDMGILIEPGNHKDLVDAMLYMLDNATKYDPGKMHKYIEDRFGYDQVGPKLYNIYLSVI